MALTDRPYRSVLYIPASNSRALEKARGLPVDAIIFDLEDAVAPAEKDNARAALTHALAQGGYGQRMKIVRINGLDTPWGTDDVSAVKDADVVLLPKVNTPGDLDALAALIGGMPIWAMMETPRGIVNAASIAAHPRLAGMVMGTNDLAKDLNCRDGIARGPLLSALQITLLAARAESIVAIDGVYNAFRDDTGLQQECEQGRDMGFDGKTLIHPAQLAIANAVFAPSDAEITLARRQIKAYEGARLAGQGVAVVDGKIVENLHIETARQLLAKAAVIVEQKES